MGTPAPEGGGLGVQDLDLSFRLRADVALDLVEWKAGDRVLDVGGGLGSFAALLSLRGVSVTLLDVVEENLAVIERRHPGVTAVLGDACALPFDDGTFDGAVCMEVLEHIDDDERAVAELRRVVRNGAALVVSVPNAAAPLPFVERLGLSSVHAEEGPERHHRDGYGADRLRQLLEDGGFAVDVVETTGGLGYRLAVGFVSLAHLVVRRAHGQRTWTWADVDAAEDGLALRLYRFVFPLFLFVARLGAARSGARGAILLARATVVADG